MADDFDVEAMLEAPYQKSERKVERIEKKSSRRDRSRSREKDRERDRDRGRDRSDRDKDKPRDKDKSSRDKDRDRERDRSSRKEERKRSNSREKREKRDKERERDRNNEKDKPRDRDRDRERDRDRDRPRRRRSRSRDRRRRSITKSPLRLTFREPELSPEERDARTVFCMQLSARIRPRDLEDFFSSVGKVKDVRIITDNKTRKSKGIAYVEFRDTESVPLALGLAGQRLLGVPIIVQVSQAEKNRQQQRDAAAAAAKGTAGPMRLYVGSLHFNITDDMLRGIFEPFGKIEEIKLIRNHETTRSQGYGFITFHNAEDAKKALEQLNGFELAGRPMKVGNVTERALEAQQAGGLDTDEMDRAGVDLGTTGRLQLMAKLAEGTGFEIPQAAADALSINNPSQQQATAAPPIATQCFMLSNMFDPGTETSALWDTEIRDDVIEECNKHGGVLHIYVDRASPQGNVYVKCPSITAAVASVNALHGRFFAGKVITAAYVPLPNYHALFPDALRATNLILASSQSASNSLLAQAPPAPVPPVMQQNVFYS